ncbi:hypothetical protein [uncultured Psychroserpens sp.]|uniref:hypothetical protein n=1 Tax=uncultured Psychroserpens sp. TaxID=255436 RepID=UPI0026104CE3|nr:hypothetical protein [uncultured Psychroserpens sp.]
MKSKLCIVILMMTITTSVLGQNIKQERQNLDVLIGTWFVVSQDKNTIVYTRNISKDDEKNFTKLEISNVSDFNYKYPKRHRKPKRWCGNELSSKEKKSDWVLNKNDSILILYPKHTTRTLHYKINKLSENTLILEYIRNKK